MNLYYTPIGILKVKKEKGFIEHCSFFNALKFNYDLSNDEMSEVLEEYFINKIDFRTTYYRLNTTTEFQKKVLSVTKDIPLGQVKTYQEIAQEIGNPKAYRAVGNALNKNPLALFIPCHRVVGQKKVYNYASGSWRKKVLMLNESGFYDDIGFVYGKVILKPYNSIWQEIFNVEKSILAEECNFNYNQIHHIGSTAITGILSKPVIDIMIELDNFNQKDKILTCLLNLGYVFRIQERPDWIFLSKGYSNKRMFHLHLMISGSDFAKEHIVFRDRLRRNPDIAKRYELLKISLLDKYKDLPKEYTANKTNFVNRYSK